MTAPFRTRPDAAKGGNWHIYPGGRRVFVRKPAATMGGGAVGPGAAALAQPRPTKPPAPVAPAPASRPARYAPPVDPIYTQQVKAASNTLEQQFASNKGERQRGLLDYGFRETGPRINGVGTPVFDPGNPFSKAALLKQNYNQQRRVAGQNMAAGAGLYSGAYQHGQDLVNRDQLGGEDELQKSLAGFLAGNSADYATAGANYATDTDQAALDAAARIAENPAYEPTADLARGATPKPKPKPKPRPGRPAAAKPPASKPSAKKYRWPGERVARHTRPIKNRHKGKK